MTIILGIDKGVLRQYLATFTLNLGMFGAGNVLGWTSTSLESIDENFKDLSTYHKSWISSIINLGGLAACLLGGFIIDSYGRKKSAILFAIPSILGWLLLFLSQNVPMLYVSRFILGFSTSFAGVVGPVYVSEISESKIRGILSNMYGVFFTAGMLFSYTVGTFVKWKVLSIICGGVPVIMLLLLWILPESPRHLLQMGKVEEGIKSFCWYRGTNSVESIAAELQSVNDSITRSKKEGKLENSVGCSDLMASKALKPLTLCVVLFLAEQLSGFAAIVAFTAEIFQSAGLQTDANLMAIIFGTVQFVSTIGSLLLIDRVGRKPLLLIGQIVMFISLAGLGAFFHLREANGGYVTDNMRWIPVFCLLAYIISFSLGIGPVATTLMGELLPQNIRGIGSAICTAVLRLSAFVISFTFGAIKESLGSQWCFWMFAIVCLVGIFVIIFFVPETKGRSLEEIEKMFL